MGWHLEKNILVTGADGFIVSHLVEHLLNLGHSVRAFCQYNSIASTGWLAQIDDKNIENLQVVFGDIRDSDVVEQAVQGTTNVMHLAALIAIPYSYKAPESYIQTNVNGTLNVMRSVLKYGVESMIHTSTSEVYGSAKYVPIDELHPINSQSPYAASKTAADQMVNSFIDSFGLPATILRPFNTYGPRQSSRALIPTIITQALNGVESIKLGSLSPTREFNFVKDTVSGFASTLQVGGIVGKTINLGNGFEISVENVAREILSALDLDIPIESTTERTRPEKSEVNRLCSNSDLAKSTLGWIPSFSGIQGLRNGLELTIEWFKNPENISHYRSISYAI